MLRIHIFTMMGFNLSARATGPVLEVAEGLPGGGGQGGPKAPLLQKNCQFFFAQQDFPPPLLGGKIRPPPLLGGADSPGGAGGVEGPPPPKKNCVFFLKQDFCPAFEARLLMEEHRLVPADVMLLPFPCNQASSRRERGVVRSSLGSLVYFGFGMQLCFGMGRDRY